MSQNNELEKLFEGVTPERSKEVLELIVKHSAQFRRVSDRAGFNLDAGAYGAVQFTQRSLKQIWLFGFAGLYSLHCYTGLIVLAKSMNLKLNIDDINSLPEQQVENDRFSDVINSIEKLNNVGSENDFLWPIEIPNPEDGKPEGVEQGAVYDLILMATAYIFLHELKHVIFVSEGDFPQSLHEEEMACDKFASDMMLSKIKEYSDESGYQEDLVYMKRSAGIALGSAFLAVATPNHNLGGTSSHPPVSKRWSAIIGNMKLDEQDYFWLYFSSLAIALMKHKNIAFPPQYVVSYKQLAISSIEAFETGILKD
ncbi:phage exclusion protein [Pectobacterium aquaticum]|uniref:Phage exclusion protein n=2 Tax=Pectobacteriaceae TaxID=1903410 RepID=A0AA93AMD7_9GAMM|nr:phage exclusion protein [Pectobacterium odoriferum]RRO20972.1 phage exclusion protein [Pectobacterium aquaticum]